MKKIIGMLIVFSMILSPVAFAASPWTEEATYADRVGKKLEFGLKNVLLGWVDLFYEPNKAHNEGTNVWAGMGKGLVDTVLNIGGGAVQLVTFLFPVDIPLPENGVALE